MESSPALEESGRVKFPKITNSEELLDRSKACLAGKKVQPSVGVALRALRGA